MQLHLPPSRYCISALSIREHLPKKKMFSFGHCLNYLSHSAFRLSKFLPRWKAMLSAFNPCFGFPPFLWFPFHCPYFGIPNFGEKGGWGGSDHEDEKMKMTVDMTVNEKGVTMGSVPQLLWSGLSKLRGRRELCESATGARLELHACNLVSC